MDLTEQQKQISPFQSFWDNLKKSKKQVESWQQQPLSEEKIVEEMKARKQYKEGNCF